MSRQIELAHVQADLFWHWEAAQRLGSRRLYTFDVARFLREHPRKRLETVDEDFAAEWMSGLRPSVAKRMTTALCHFFDFLLEQGAVNENPIRQIKSRRRHGVSDLQTNFFARLKEKGIQRGVARELVWADFVAPLIESPKTIKVQVGRRLVKLEPALWRKLEKEFRNLAPGEDLRTLLRRKIAS